MATSPEYRSDHGDLVPSRGTSVAALRFYALWTLAALTYGFGDMVTTLALVPVTGFYEGNPLVRVVLVEFGPLGLAAMKFGTIALCVALSVWAARDGGRLAYYGGPVLLILLGVAATAHNLLVLVG